MWSHFPWHATYTPRKAMERTDSLRCHEGTQSPPQLLPHQNTFSATLISHSLAANPYRCRGLFRPTRRTSHVSLLNACCFWHCCLPADDSSQSGVIQPLAAGSLHPTAKLLTNKVNSTGPGCYVWWMQASCFLGQWLRISCTQLGDFQCGVKCNLFFFSSSFTTQQAERTEGGEGRGPNIRHFSRPKCSFLHPPSYSLSCTKTTCTVVRWTWDRN